VLQVLACRHVPTQLALQGSTRPSAWPSAVAPNVRFALQQAQRLGGSAPFMFGLPGNLALGNWSLQPVALPSTVAVADLSLTLLVDEAVLHGRVNYNGQLFGRERIEQLCGMFVHLLREIVAAPPTTAIDALPLQAPQQAAREMARASGPLVDYGPDIAVHRMFEEQVRRAPDAVAVVCGAERCTYRELDARAELVAAHLRRRALGAEPRVGLYMSRSIDMVAAFMGALKAGACTVMLEPSLPAARIGYIMQNSQMALVMTDAASAPRLGDCQLPLLDIGALAPCPDAPPAAEVDPDNAAYIIYTSGSTGQPKGVVGLHRGITNRTRWMIAHFGLSAQDRVLHTTPLGFVRAEREILFPLSAGATLVVLPGEGLNEPDAVLASLREHAITYSASSPSLLRMMLDQDKQAMSALHHLKRWFIGADALKPALVQELQQVRPSLQLTYFYGSTEVSSDVAYYDVPVPYRVSGLTTPIGLPLSNTTIHLLDPNMQPVPAGMPGQLYIGGVQLARGYFGHEQLTEEKFIPDPFSERAGARLYASGDMGYRLPDGNLVVIGRNDDQVKIHGHRIELGEIEHALRSLLGVRDVVVLVHHKDSEHPLIVAYLVADHAVNRHYLRPQLVQRLPSYMIPGVFLQLPQLPVTPLGKLDRSALLAMPLADAALPNVAPSGNALESEMVQVLAQLLGVPAAGIDPDDNFFELGANSAAISQFVVALRTAHPELTIRIADVYRHFTIRLLATALSASTAPASSAATAAEPVPTAAELRAQARRRALNRTAQ
jgi:amino acid adenylation domain-containing protein